MLVSVPEEPGVYLFKDSEGKILYAGKALSLKRRLRSYLPGPSTPSKPALLVGRAADVETIITRSDLEAVMLEQTMISRNRPPYNVIWRDNKSFPCLEITLEEDFPRIHFTRRTRRKGSRHYGPYTAGTARRLQRIVNQHFRIPSCRVETDGRQTPCLYHHLNWCDAPCAGLVSRENYAALVSQVRLFLDGHTAELKQRLAARMEDAAGREDFEEAARLRDRLRAVDEMREEQAVVAPDEEDTFVLGLARSGGFACLAMIVISAGKVVGKRDFVVRRASGETDAELVTSFMGQHLSQVEIPPRIYVPCELESQDLAERWLSTNAGRTVRLIHPMRGRGRELLEIAQANARAAMITRGRVGEDEAREQIEAVAGVLGLARTPSHIEGVDLSRLGRDEAVGATVVFREGLPAPSEYRRYLIRTARGDDDYACMRETVERRLRRLKESGAALPDLVLLDGGSAHLGAVGQLVRELDCEGMALAALAKREEELFLPGRREPVRLPEDSPALSAFRRIRDEAHRYVNAYHRHRRIMAQRAGAKSLRKPGRERALSGGERK